MLCQGQSGDGGRGDGDDGGTAGEVRAEGEVMPKHAVGEGFEDQQWMLTHAVACCLLEFCGCYDSCSSQQLQQE